jgi:DNA-nicking Smr family endonuclease
MKLDLHGMRTRDAIDLFIRECNKFSSAGGERMEVVHGYGSSGVGGDIKEALMALLDAYPDKVRYIKGELVGNRGVTVVIPDSKLPYRRTSIDAVICSILLKPRSIAQIEVELHGLATTEEIKASLSALMSLGKASRITQGSRFLYIAK